MTIRDTPAYRAGYDTGRVHTPSLVRAIEPPKNYTDAEVRDYISGFLLGARTARNDALMDGWEYASDDGSAT